MQFLRSLMFAAVITLPFSCAQEQNESARSVEERTLEARVQTKYLDTLHKTASGLYYMIQAKGSGTPVEKENFVYVCYSDLDFNENYMRVSAATSKVSTSDERVARQMGDYTDDTYYGPQLWYAGGYALMEGIDEVIQTMKVGDKRRIWLPSWRSSYGYPGSSATYANTTIHDVEILRVVTDIEKFQIDSLESYRDRYYPGVDSTSYGFYKKTLVEGIGDTLKSGDKANVWYIGRLLDDFVFDTNIADSAKKYNIYTGSDSKYVASGYDIQENEVTESGGAGSPVTGFAKALLSMKHGEEAIVFFYSSLGYGAQGNASSGGQIQPYSPLVFYIKIESDGDDDTEDDS